MKFNNAVENESFTEKRDENYFDGIEHSAFAQKRSGIKLSGILRNPLLVYLIGGVALAVMAGIIVLRSGKSFQDGSIKEMDARLKQMEDQMIATELMEKQLDRIESQTEKMDSLMKRIETMETNLAARIEQISKQVRSAGAVSKKKGSTSPEKKRSKSAAGKGKRIYHQVRTGDTLYSISQTYQLSLKELRALNPSLGGKLRIYPGQKLRVKKR